jgi:hypothetical protein
MLGPGLIVLDLGVTWVEAMIEHPNGCLDQSQVIGCERESFSTTIPDGEPGGLDDMSIEPRG